MPPDFFSSAMFASPCLLRLLPLAGVDQLADLLSAFAADLLVELVSAFGAHGLAAFAADRPIERRAVALLGRLPAFFAAAPAGFANADVAFALLVFGRHSLPRQRPVFLPASIKSRTFCPPLRPICS